MKGRTGLLFSLIIAAYSYGIAAQRTVCEHAAVADIVFLVDGSSNIPTQIFQDYRNYLRNTIRTLDIGPNKVRIGLAQYSDVPKQEFLLKDYMDRKSLLAAVETFPQRRGGKKSGVAINFLKTSFTREAGCRVNQRVPHIAVVITDGQFEDSDDVATAALELRKQGVFVFAIGVGNYNYKKLASIANWPPERFLLTSDSYNTVERLTEALLRTLCLCVEEQRKALADKYADIFFLVDSGITQSHFATFKQDLNKLISQLSVGASTYRIGLAQYGEETNVEFLLNAHQTKKDILNSIRQFRLRPHHNQPCKLGSTLQYASTHFFTREAGGRAHLGSRQFLVIVSGRRSVDHVSRMAQKIEAEGITVVGIKAGAPVDALERFASNDYIFDSAKLTGLKNIFTTEKTERIISDCKGANRADIVFIIDEARSIGTANFQLILTFLRSVLSGLLVSLHKVRVGIVTYSSKPKAHVYLNTFKDQAELLQYINILPYNAGDRYTGAALNFTWENIFTDRNNAQKVAVVITGGKSKDSVREAATSLRRNGVTIYAVGMDTNTAELEMMASYPTYEHVYTMNSFTKLKPLRQSLLKYLCSNIIREVIRVSTSNTYVRQGCIQKDEADIFFLIDDSGSIFPEDFKEMKKFIIYFLDKFHIEQNHVRVGVIKYSERTTLEFDLTEYQDPKSLKEAVMRIWHEGGGTKTGAALSDMTKHFKRAASTRVGQVPNYLIVITDGKSMDDVTGYAQELRAQDIEIYAVGVKNANKAELEIISGDTTRTYYVEDFSTLKYICNGIITDICYQSACHDVPLDLFFLADSSESISAEGYQYMKNFIKTIISKYDIGPNLVRIGVMQFSSDQTLTFDLVRRYNKDEMLRAIDAMQQLNEGTRTGAAIEKVSQYFVGNPEREKRLVVITDGRAQDDVKGPAAALREKGVLIYAIGVDKAETSHLVEISGSYDRILQEKEFKFLKKHDNDLVMKLCKKECQATERADIIFLVDGSTSITTEDFISIKKFMKSLVNKTAVGKQMTRFGVILYADDPKSIFDLKDYNSKKGVLKAITDIVQVKGNTYTSKALTYSVEFFETAHGGRKDSKVSQILMVITDGEATDNNNLKQSSDKLREKGVTVFSIGVKDAKKEELEIMANGDKNKVFCVEDYSALETSYHSIFTALCNSTQPDCEKKADVVFLLDHSGSITQENYEIMKDFTTDLVKSLNISQDLWHAGLAQFSEKLTPEFHLNNYYRKEDMITHINKMKYLGGSTFIGEALRSIEWYFNVANGSRASAEIPKKLVLITDGDSYDDVEDAANHLRKMKVEVFAVGIGDIHDLELLIITGDPESLLYVRNFKDLGSIKQMLTNKICQSEMPVKSDCNVDILMGFDISQRTRAPGEMLVSGHPKLKTFLPEIAHYISTLQLCCRSHFETKIAYQVVARDGRFLYDPDFDFYSEDVVKKVMSHPVSESSFFNTALLQTSIKTFRTKSTSSVKVLVIFSDGLDEDVSTLMKAAEKLRKSGVSALLIVALEGVYDTAQLQMLEFGRGATYKLPLSIGMPSVSGNILNQINAVSEKVCCNVTCKCFGPEGMRGSPGKQAGKGEDGKRGHPGHTGDEGVMGERGPPGPPGLHGTEGCPGVRGKKGSRGIWGYRGEDGEDGLDGVPGEQGAMGLNGQPGSRGHQGNPGIPGIRGEPGVKGQRGLRGDPGEPGIDNYDRGPKGDRGHPGLPGKDGRDGKEGDPGEAGNQGPDGRKGPFGQKGGTGRLGAKGHQGPAGNAGPQGKRGDKGDQGPKGTSGFPGTQGEPGQTGNLGTAGHRGPNGQKGQPGEPGVKGAPGSQGPRGMPGQDGRDGHGDQGPKGSKGDSGFPGFPGHMGERGLNGTTGGPGHRGNPGRAGNSGRSGDPGEPGDPGHPGHRGNKGPPGIGTYTECELISYIRDNCSCCGHSPCPAYPTELVFALDMSKNVDYYAFRAQIKTVISILENISLSESNCPTGARVAVVGYNTTTKYLIRFQDYRSKKQLIDAVNKTILPRTYNSGHLGDAMRFVGQNVFKHVRSGLRVRKVAVFFSHDPQQNFTNLLSAIMLYQALNIIPVVISQQKAPIIRRAMEVDDSGRSIFLFKGTGFDDVLRCAICYDSCRPEKNCRIRDVQVPQEVDVDLVMVVDSSREMQVDDYAGAQQLLGSVVEQLAVSSQPRRADNKARVAVVQQSGTQAPKLEFGLQTYGNHNAMKKHLIQTMRQQGGTSSLGHTLEFALRDVLLKAREPRRKRAMLAVVGTETARIHIEKLHLSSKRAHCEGVALFVVAVGDRYSQSQVEKLASPPLQQHLIHLDRLKAQEQGYARRFFRIFLSALNKGYNKYPEPSFKDTCNVLHGQGGSPFFSEGSADHQEEIADEAVEAEVKAEVEVEAVTVAPTRGDAQTSQTEVSGTSTGQAINAPEILPMPELNSSVSKDACVLGQDPGSCENYTMMWFYDNEQSECSRFWYGGCGGNKNRFETQEQCENLCLTKTE